MKRLTHILAFLLIGATASSQTVVSFTFGTSGSPTTGPSNSAANVSTGTFSASLGSGAPSSTSPLSTTAGGSGGSYFTANTFRTSDNNYFQFTLTPASGYQVTLSSVSFFYLSTSTGPNASSLQSSADNFGSNLASFSLTRAGGTPTASDWHQSSTSITLTFTGATTFHITGSGASSSAGAFRVDDVLLNGSVSAIPEPSTYAAIIGALALAGAAWQRRRRKTIPSAAANIRS